MSDMTPKELTALKLKFYGALVRDPNLSAMDLRIAWLLLSQYLNAQSLVAWPSAETMARDLGSSLRGVRNSIQRLTAPDGWFKITQGGGRGHSNVYTANFERVNATSPCGRARGDTVSPLERETVNARSLKGEVAFPERMNSSSPDSPLSKPIEEPLETRGARAEHPGHTVPGLGNDDQKDARQGDRGDGNQPSEAAAEGSASESEVLTSLMETMPEDGARRCLRNWCDYLGSDEALSRMQRILHEGPNAHRWPSARSLAASARCVMNWLRPQ